MIWFAQRDWNLIGIGMEGFDIVEIIWEPEIFEEQKSFLFNVIDAILTRISQYALSNDNNLNLNFILFRNMIDSFKLNNVSKDKEYGIFPFFKNIERYDKCNIHNVYKHSEGCIIL